MKRIALTLIFFIAALNCAPKKHQERSLFGFPDVRPPIAEADPKIREIARFKIPTKLLVNRENTVIGIKVDTSSLVDTVLSVGRKMATGFSVETYVISGGKRTLSSIGTISGKEAYFGEENLFRDVEGFPIIGESYFIEMVIKIFETDIPPQHMWRPESARYRILWTDTLRSAPN